MPFVNRGQYKGSEWHEGFYHTYVIIKTTG